MKKAIRAIIFLRRHFKYIAIPSMLCMIFVIIFFALRPIKVVEGKNAENAEQITLVDEKEQIRVANAKERAAPEYNVLEEKRDISGIYSSYATLHKTEQPIILSDIYTEEDNVVVFKSFYPEAKGYTWEIYDESIQEWKRASEGDVTVQRDELNRNISSYIVEASEENNNLMVRCTMDFPENESTTDIAVLHVLDKSIAKISFEDFTTEAGEYITAMDIPVKVRYADGSKETITGLNGLSFLDVQISSEEKMSVSGNAVETIITTIKPYEYMRVGTGEEDVSVRYKFGETSIDASVKLTGADMTDPIISAVAIEDFSLSNNKEEPVLIKVMIDATDNSTPYQCLQYAFLPEKTTPEESDWKNSPVFETEIAQNGKWIAYCKDQAGNTATIEKDIIAVDDNAPVVSLHLEIDSGWCQANKILVDVTDDSPVEYCFNCAETDAESGWISKNEYDVTKNSTWQVKVRDAAGNITEKEISIDNIDDRPPVIIKITEKEGETTVNDEEN